MKKGMKICAVSLATCMLMVSGSNISASAAENVSCTHSWTVRVKGETKVIDVNTHLVEEIGTERIVNCVYYTSQEYYDIICRSCGTVVAQEKGIGTPVHSVSHN